jgi:phosphotransacetylase
VETARAAALLLKEKPRVAMISHSTRGSVHSTATQRIAAATQLARERARRAIVPMEVDGEMEADAALDPATAQRKGASSPLQGQANVLIFPGMTTARTSAHLLQTLAGAEPCGHLLLGLARPVAQVSPAATVQTIFRAALATAMRSVSYRDVIAAEPE